MKQDIFETVGKRTPYKVPDGFFEASEQQLKTAALAEHRPASPDRIQTTIPLRRRWYYAIAASIVLVIGIFSMVRFALQESASTADEPVYAQTYDASDDWSDFADADIFLENMEW